MDANPIEFRAQFGLPEDVPASLIDVHLAEAAALLRLDTNRTDAPIDAPAADYWRLAHLYRTYQSVVPFLHLFALRGAARAGRLIDKSVEFRFLDPSETQAAAADAAARYQYYLGLLALPAEDAGASPALGMLAV